jgi:hypothetical protein
MAALGCSVWVLIWVDWTTTSDGEGGGENGDGNNGDGGHTNRK